MSRVDTLLHKALAQLPAKPADTATRAEKRRYSELVSEAVAQAFAEELRQRGMKGARPSVPGQSGVSGAERRMAGGIGAKNVDVTWSTEESGLLVAISIKSINFKDRRTQNFQKNLTNRRGDMLFEAVTLHRRFPYAVLFGFFLLDRGASSDNSGRRRSTFENAHQRLRLFTDRDDPEGRDEQYERMYVGLLDSDPKNPGAEFFHAGYPTKPIALEDAFARLIDVVAERNPDFYEVINDMLVPVR